MEQSNELSHRIEPSNSIEYKGRTIKARIDPDLAVKEVLKQICKALKCIESPTNLALRDVLDEELVTDANLANKVREGATLKVSPSPGIEAADTLVTLNHALNPHETPSASAGKLSPLKLVLFKLQRHVREEQFTTEFMAKGGLGSLVELLAIDSSEVSGFDTVKGEFGTSAPGLAGNSLAYALLGLSAILDLPYRITWDLLGSAFLKRIVKIVARAPNHNVVRPATNVLSKLLRSNNMPDKASEGQAAAFYKVWSVFSAEKDLLDVVISRVGSSDVELATSSLALLNTMIRCSTIDKTLYITTIETLQTKRAPLVIARTLATSEASPVRPYIIEFQQLYIHSLRTLQLASAGSESTDALRQSLVPFGEELTETGLLDSMLLLDLLKDEAYIADVKATNVYCSLQAACKACTLILLRYFQSTSSDSPRPFLLDFARLHRLLLRFFFRCWRESHATADDEYAVEAVVSAFTTSELASSPSWLQLEDSLRTTPYRTIKARQLETLALEPALPQVQTLRQKLRDESFSFLQKQRIHCMQQGSWFHSGFALPSAGIESGRVDAGRPWRFVILSPDAQTLTWTDSHERAAESSSWTYESVFPAGNSLDLSTVEEVKPQTSRPVDKPQQAIPSQISFSLLSATDRNVHFDDGRQTAGRAKSLLDLVAIDNDHFSEWIDGLRFLFSNKPYSEDSMTRASAAYLKTLTDLTTQVRLLDIEAEDLEQEDEVDFGKAPSSVDFCFA